MQNYVGANDVQRVRNVALRSVLQTENGSRSRSARSSSTWTSSFCSFRSRFDLFVSFLNRRVLDCAWYGSIVGWCGATSQGSVCRRAEHRCRQTTHAVKDEIKILFLFSQSFKILFNSTDIYNIVRSFVRSTSKRYDKFARYPAFPSRWLTKPPVLQSNSKFSNNRKRKNERKTKKNNKKEVLPACFEILFQNFHTIADQYRQLVRLFCVVSRFANVKLWFGSER